MITATMFEAKTRLSELVRLAQMGETVVITSGRDRTPVARLEAVAPAPKPQRLGLLYDPNVPLPEGFVQACLEPLSEEELRLWEEGDPDDPLYTGRAR